MCEKQNITAFITNDFTIQDFEFSNIERYELTSCLKSRELSPQDYDFTEYNETFTSWANDNLSYEELYELPMMNAIYYYPSFVTFQEEDRYKTSSTTTLFYDTELDTWAVGLTGGGMDLTPNLLDTFINLGKGVPFNIAEVISKDYTAYIDKERHLNNCQILSDAFRNVANRNIQRAKGLSTNI
jgi:hypothetical protein